MGRDAGCHGGRRPATVSAGARRYGVAALCGVLMAAAACGQSPTTPAAGSAGKPASRPAVVSRPAAAKPPTPSSRLKTVDLELDFLPEGNHAAFAAALKQGYYKAEGLNVRIIPGKGSFVTTQHLLNGHATFGIADFGVASKLIAKGAPLKAVMALEAESPYCVTALASKHIQTPAALRGRTFAINPRGLDRFYIDAFLKGTGIPLTAVKTVAVDPSEKILALVQGRVDAIIGSTTNEIPLLDVEGYKIHNLCLPQYHISLAGETLYASDATIASEPGLVRAFVAATIKGFRYAQAHRAAAVADIIALFPSAGIKPAVGNAQLNGMIATLHTPTGSREGKPVGWFDPAFMRQVLSTLKANGGLPGAKPASAFYTDAFIPGGV